MKSGLDYIDAKARRWLSNGDARIMIDCGADWLHRLRAIAPTVIVLTHAHGDHAAGLVIGAPCPVYATTATWKVLHRLPISDRRIMPRRKAVRIGGVRFSAFPVMHSPRAPAVGYRVSSPRRCFFYLPDVAELPNPVRALRRIDLYIGDGATIRRSMVRRKGSALIGHAPIIHQLDLVHKGACPTHYLYLLWVADRARQSTSHGFPGRPPRPRARH